ncbi:MAG: ribosome silencing factor [Proteobacteria bacterium]|nr:ribosome silencing factor [Pseudomonadota bacterium]
MVNSIELGQIAASAAVDKKAGRISLLDVRGLTDMCEVALVCSAENERQSQAVAEAIEERCKKVAGFRPLAVEGRQVGNWVLLDYGSLVVHVFLTAARDFYAFDTLWPQAKKIHVDGVL